LGEHHEHLGEDREMAAAVSAAKRGEFGCREKMQRNQENELKSQSNPQAEDPTMAQTPGGIGIESNEPPRMTPTRQNHGETG